MSRKKWASRPSKPDAYDAPGSNFGRGPVCRCALFSPSRKSLAVSLASFLASTPRPHAWHPSQRADRGTQQAPTAGGPAGAGAIAAVAAGAPRGAAAPRERRFQTRVPLRGLGHLHERPSFKAKGDRPNRPARPLASGAGAALQIPYQFEWGCGQRKFVRADRGVGSAFGTSSRREIFHGSPCFRPEKVFLKTVKEDRPAAATHQ